MKTQVKADLMLVLVTLGWGISYYLTDLCLQEMESFNLNAFRFLGAFAVAAAATFPKLKNVNKTTLKYAFFIALSLVFVYTGVTFGVMYTSLSNSGFLCGLTVVFTPILSFFIKKQKPEKKILVVIVVCFVGIALMSLNEQMRPALGDIFCLLCAVAYAVDLLITETAVAKEEVDAFQLGVFQLGFTGVLMLALSFLFETPVLPSSSAVWWSAVFLAVFVRGLLLSYRRSHSSIPRRPMSALFLRWSRSLLGSPHFSSLARCFCRALISAHFCWWRDFC